MIGMEALVRISITNTNWSVGTQQNSRRNIDIKAVELTVYEWTQLIKGAVQVRWDTTQHMQHIYVKMVSHNKPSNQMHWQGQEEYLTLCWNEGTTDMDL